MSSPRQVWLWGRCRKVKIRVDVLGCSDVLLVLCSPPSPGASLVPGRAHNEKKIKLTLKYMQQLFHLLQDIFNPLINQRQ